MPLSPGTRLGVFEILSRSGRGAWARSIEPGTRSSSARSPSRSCRRRWPSSRSAWPASSVKPSSSPHSIIHTSRRFTGSTRRAAALPGHGAGRWRGPLRRIKRGPIPIDEALEIARQIAEALEAAHGRGIVHRDLKPANIRLAAGGRVKVLDFGLAKTMVPDAPPGADASLSATTTADGTVIGAVMGTPGYMSPEQARGDKVDERSDIWSFGCVLWVCLTRQKLFPGATASDSIGDACTPSRTGHDFRRHAPDRAAPAATLPRQGPARPTAPHCRCANRVGGLGSRSARRRGLHRAATRAPSRRWRPP